PMPAVAQSAAENSLSFTQKLAIYRACRADLNQHCPEAGTSGPRIEACLRTNKTRLTEACRTTILQTGLR
ncbi:cysteine rich repeat-containing protein, partial [Klebsiella pneumoniae]|uniref:cysteine rich repeat-containing protein n=1 Tax=Klebsiella pneumoniae TaxID=573 RepID=UPI0013D118C7